MKGSINSFLDLENDEEGQNFSTYFEYDKVIGEGAFGIVVSAYKKNDQTRQKYAIKVIKKSLISDGEHDLLIQEAQILSSLHHPNIVKFYDVIITDKKMMIVMELLEEGTVTQLIQEKTRNNQKISDEEASLLMKTLFSAVDYIHSKGIIHRDLKPDNVMIKNKNDLSTVKIVDFGISAHFSKLGYMSSLTAKCGTLLFMAPELAFKKQYKTPVDLWACGIILYLLCSGGKHPLAQADSPEIVLAQLNDPLWVFPQNFSNLAKNLFLKLVDVNPLNRYSAETASAHPWITRKFDEEIPMTGFEHWTNFENEQKISNLTKGIYFLYYLQKKISEQQQEKSQQCHYPKFPKTRTNTYKKLVIKVSEKREKDLLPSKSTTNKVWNVKDYAEILHDIYNPPLRKSKSKVAIDEENNVKAIKRIDTLELIQEIPGIGDSSKKLIRLGTRKLLNDVPSIFDLNEEALIDQQKKIFSTKKQQNKYLPSLVFDPPKLNINETIFNANLIKNDNTSPTKSKNFSAIFSKNCISPSIIIEDHLNAVKNREKEAYFENINNKITIKSPSSKIGPIIFNNKLSRNLSKNTFKIAFKPLNNNFNLNIGELNNEFNSLNLALNNEDHDTSRKYQSIKNKSITDFQSILLKSPLSSLTVKKENTTKKLPTLKYNNNSKTNPYLLSSYSKIENITDFDKKISKFYTFNPHSNHNNYHYPSSTKNNEAEFRTNNQNNDYQRNSEFDLKIEQQKPMIDVHPPNN